MLVITDGWSSKPWITASQASLARDEKIRMYAIAVGNDINLNELHAIASFPKDSHIFTAPDYTGLQAMEHTILNELCSKSLRNPCSTINLIACYVDKTGIFGICLYWPMNPLNRLIKYETEHEKLESSKFAPQYINNMVWS